MLQTVLNLSFLAGIIFLWRKLNRPMKDDPRMSKGLQLLQSKISILEDLSDRTETQVQQLLQLLEAKYKDVQKIIDSAQVEINEINKATQKSLEVANIFKDRIPHQEIIERQKTIKYVNAARMAHQGMTAQEIARQVDLSTGEIDFILKTNKDQLLFCEKSLPEWINGSEKPQSELNSLDSHGFIEPLFKNEGHISNLPSSTVESAPMKSNEAQALEQLGQLFKKASMIGHLDFKSPVDLINTVNGSNDDRINGFKKIEETKDDDFQVAKVKFIEADVVNAQGQKKKALIRPMEFTKIE